MTRGYFGIGIYNPIKSANVGALYRSAFCFGANYIYTIGAKYKRDKSDTPNAANHIPYFHYSSLEEFLAAVPKGCVITCIENTDKAIPLTKFSHPEKACYLLGSEVTGLPKELTDKYPTTIIPTTACLNVSTAGSITMFDRISKGSK